MSTHGSLTDCDYEELAQEVSFLRLQLQAVDDRLRACELEQARQSFNAEQRSRRISALESFLYRFRQLLQALLGFHPPSAGAEP